MIDYGIVRSSEKPESIIIDDYSVWKNTNIEEVTVTDPETGVEKPEYEFNMVQYTKDEFILEQSQENSNLADQITDTQLALCEVYEMLM